MRTLKIHYTIKGQDDYYVLTGDTIDDIINQNKLEMKRRNLNAKDNDCWSEELVVDKVINIADNITG
jgi:hypothetical protein